MKTNFLLGKIRITAAAQALLRRTPLDLIARHAINDHGKISSREQHQNRLSMETVGPVLSRYCVDPTNVAAGHVLVITEKLWRSTLVQLESEQTSRVATAPPQYV